MKRTMTAVAALTLIVAACGSGDDASSDATADTPTEATVETTTDDTAEESTAAESTVEESGDAAEMSTEDTTEGTTEVVTVEPADDDSGDDGDEPSGPAITSLDDVPEVCRDAMADFLRQIEPVVEPIDWESATMADFEQIAIEFESKAAEFEAVSVDVGCDDLNFDDEASAAILIEFAQSEAPGAVGFLQFLDDLSTGVATGLDDTEGIGTCQDAIDFLQGLMDEYDTIASVPASELLKIPSIASLYADCTVEQLEFFDNPDLEEFMNP